MLKRSESIDPGTQEYGTSQDLPGTTRSLANTPVGETGPKSQTPTGEMVAKSDKDTGQRPAGMRKSDFGVRLAMDTYVQGFMDKCAETGVDGRTLIKHAFNWSKFTGVAAPALKRINPLNLFTASSKLIKSLGQMRNVRSNLVENLIHTSPEFQQLAPNLQAQAVGHAMSSPANIYANSIRKMRREQFKNLAGGLASTAGLSGVGYALARPEPPPPHAFLPMADDRIKEYFNNMIQRS